MAKVGLEGEELTKEIQVYVQYLEKNTGHICINEKEINFDKALAISAIEIAIKRHAGYLAQSFDPVLGIVPGTPVGRDLRKVQRVIAVGGIFAHSTKEEALKILHKSFADRGISLLPEKPEFVVDHNYQLYTIGAMAEEYPNEALMLAKNNIS
ncbi:glutamate mutase, mutL [Desulfosporosinus sp. I2]|nr:glutamate mutase, mutL [Desulfosporosinus sp. I2]